MHTKFLTILLFPLFALSACGCATALPADSAPSESSLKQNESALTDPKAARPQSRTWDTSDVSLAGVANDKKLIALTFDDAPSRTMENILTVFTAYNEANPDCKAYSTFFLNGYLFDSANVHLLHGAIALGMELGNHTYSHTDLTTLSPDEIRREIDKTDRLLQKIDGKERHLLRAPFGKINRTVRQISETPLIDWNVDTLDWSGASADEIFQRIYEAKSDGAIVLLHDGYFPTVDALKRLLPALKQADYQAVSVSQLAKAHNCILESGKVYIRARPPQERT